MIVIKNLNALRADMGVAMSVSVESINALSERNRIKFMRKTEEI